MKLNLNKELNEYKTLNGFKQIIIERINDPKNTNPYNFGFEESDPSSHDLCDWIDDCGSAYDPDDVWLGLKVICGAHWANNSYSIYMKMCDLMILYN